jgi:predicted lysophospholipase L1 biosynthesis ABC-type transport system permease subunit
MKDLLPNTQPNVEVVEIQRQQEGRAKPKKTSTKQQWGPTIPMRRSSRLIDNGKIVEANAQDFKRKWNLEENKGISQNANNIPSVSKSFLFLLLRI